MIYADRVQAGIDYIERNLADEIKLSEIESASHMSTLQFKSMSRKGNCMDNGAMENFFGRLKVEMF